MKKYYFTIALLCIMTCQTSFASTPQQFSALVVDQDDGSILYEHLSNSKIYPASLVKILTLYIVFECIQNKYITWNSQITISHNANSQPKSKIDLPVGSKISIREAVLSLIIKSANDVAVAIAESISGSEKKFAKLMNSKAIELGMTNSRFVNASGLHDNKQFSTAQDMAKLAIAIKKDFPQYYKMFSEQEFTFRGKKIIGHNTLAMNNKNIDGLKTGYTNASGHNLITSTKTKSGARLLGIIIGTKTKNERDEKMLNILKKSEIFYNIPKIETVNDIFRIPYLDIS